MPTYTCLSAGLTAWEGATPTFPCPSAPLTGASRQGAPPSTPFMPISTSDGHRRVGESLEPLSREGRRISTLGGAWAAGLSQAQLTGGGRHGFPAVAVADRESPFTHVDSVMPLADRGSYLGHRGWGFRQAYESLRGAEGRESRELGWGRNRPRGQLERSQESIQGEEMGSACFSQMDQ